MSCTRISHEFDHSTVSPAGFWCYNFIVERNRRLVLYPVLLLAGGFRPQVHHIRWALAFLCATATPIFFLNRLLGTNFFFLNNPYSNAITAFFARCLGEHFYVCGFLPVLAAIWVLLYLPWYKAEQHQRMVCAKDQIVVWSIWIFNRHVCFLLHPARVSALTGLFLFLNFTKGLRW